MPEFVILDTNVLVRFLTGGPPEFYAPAARLLEQGPGEGRTLVVTATTMSELVFVLRGSVYQWSRTELVAALEAILDLPLEILDRAEIERARQLFATNHDDWDDGLLAAYALERAAGHIVSFDRGLDAIPGIKRLDPLAAT